MIYNDGNSELHIRLHIAEMLKDKVEQPNYNELCEKALKFVLDGIELPKIKKTPAEEAADMFTKTFLFANPIQDALKELEKGELPKSKEDELKDTAKRWDRYCITHKGHLCYICGYSTEFNCLIAGTYDDCDNADLLGNTDVFDKITFKHFFYIPLDDRFKS